MKSIASIATENPQRYGKLYEQAKKDYEILTSEGSFFPHKPELRKLGIDAYLLNIMVGPHNQTVVYR